MTYIQHSFTATGTANTTWAGMNYTAATGTVAWTPTWSTGNLVNTNKRKAAKVYRRRGWNSRNATRCANCSRFARLVVEGSSVDRAGMNVNYHIVVECRRCGYEVGFRGRRF